MTGDVLPSRFSRQEVAYQLPGGCALCGAFQGPFVDTGVNKLEGRLYLCLHCLAEAARVGLPEPEPVVTIVEKIPDDFAGVVSSFFDSASAVLALCVSLAGEQGVHEDADGSAGASDRKASGTARQDDNALSDEGTVSVPSSSGDELTDFDAL